jgi:hypothetical protein
MSLPHGVKCVAPLDCGWNEEESTKECHGGQVTDGHLSLSDKFS